MVALSHLFTYFNSRPHGGRLFYRKLALRPHYFNSRPHGGRPSASPTAFCCANFNSRPHGGRRRTCRHWLSGLLFQLTPSRRATPLVIFFAHQAIFQLTPSRRVTLKLSKGGRLTIISTHALTEGDADIFCRFLRQKISTHALTEGDKDSVAVAADALISTHALTAGDVARQHHRCTL